jgi:hypothetical protein
VGTPLPAKPSAPVSLAAQVNAAQAGKVTIPAGMGLGKSTENLESIWMRALIYGETNARKTTTAAEFGSPEDVRIILTRGEDQLLPLAGRPYKYEHCDNAMKFRFACMYPEKLWPEWAGRANRILVIDDVSKAKDYLLDDNEFDEKGRKQNNMLVHREAKADMSGLTKSLFSKPMHVVMVAFASIYENPVTHEENVGPDVPPAISRMLTADFTFVLYIDKSKNMFRTNDFRETYEDTDEKMVKKTFTRIITAKHKIPKHLVGKGVVNDLEPLDLLKVWEKVRAASKTKVGAGK